jgi:hypothetical protein
MAIEKRKSKALLQMAGSIFIQMALVRRMEQDFQELATAFTTDLTTLEISARNSRDPFKPIIEQN